MLLWEVVVGAVLGVVAGVLGGLALRAVRKWTTAERASLLTVSITLALGVLGAVKLVQSDGLIAVFAAGLMFNRFFSGELQETKEHVHEALRRLFELPVFAALGVVLPWGEWNWRLLGFAVAVILLRRLPVLLALRPALRPLRNLREALFVGWFGPIGIAALLYATVAEKKVGLHDAWVAATLVIVLSVGLHGCTATPLTRVFHSQTDEQQDK